MISVLDEGCWLGARLGSDEGWDEGWLGIELGSDEGLDEGWRLGIADGDLLGADEAIVSWYDEGSSTIQ
jgi:hypothetical protein